MGWALPQGLLCRLSGWGRGGGTGRGSEEVVIQMDLGAAMVTAPLPRLDPPTHGRQVAEPAVVL